MTITVILIVAGMYKGFNHEFFIKLRCFLPSAMGNFMDVTTQFVFHVCGIQLMLYQAVGMVAIIVGSILLMISFRNFRNHQVG